MKKPQHIRIEIYSVTDGKSDIITYTEDDLDDAITLLQLMNGDITEEDLQP